MIDKLIDKQDNFEIIGDEIYNILSQEVESQKQLAIDGGKNYSLWDFEVYQERSIPFEKFLNQDETSNELPIVNVWYENSNLNVEKSNSVQKQSYSSTYNIDIYASKNNKKSNNGHESADELSAKEAQRIAKFVRNILMASIAP